MVAVIAVNEIHFNNFMDLDKERYMMIYHVSGDPLLTKTQVIVHGIAPNGPMNQGLALSLHEKYPAMHKDFQHWCHQDRPKPGDAWMWGSSDNVRIINLITQEGG